MRKLKDLIIILIIITTGIIAILYETVKSENTQQN